jgi:hypothetical protein
MHTRLYVILMFVGLALPGCWDAPGEAPAQAAPPPAAALAPLSSGNTLDQALGLLEAELQAAAANNLEGSGVGNVLRAEAITDRLLETRQPFEWITAERYFVDARIRQIQSEADRIVAQIQSGVARDSVVAAISGLADAVTRLRGELAAGGTQAPPPLRQLLEADSVPDVRPG